MANIHLLQSHKAMAWTVVAVMVAANAWFFLVWCIVATRLQCVECLCVRFFSQLHTSFFSLVFVSQKQIVDTLRVHMYRLPLVYYIFFYTVVTDFTCSICFLASMQNNPFGGIVFSAVFPRCNRTLSYWHFDIECIGRRCTSISTTMSNSDIW